MSFRVRLSALVALALAPPIALSVYNTRSWTHFLEEQAAAEGLSAARLISGQLAHVVEGSRHLMQAVVDHPSVPGDEEGCAAHFSTVVAKVPIYRELALIDREGRFHCSTIPIPPDLNVRDRFYFTEPLRTGQLTIGTVTRGRVTGQFSVHLTMPYKSPEGEFDGVIAIILNPDAVAQQLAKLQPQQRLAVLDREGSLVFAVPNEDRERVTAVAAEAFRHASPDEDGIATISVGGEQEIVGYVPVNKPPQGLFIAVATKRSLAVQRAQEFGMRNAALAGVAFSLAILGAWSAGHFLIRRPIIRMIEAARRRGAGEMTAEFPALNERSELGQLSAELAKMSRNVDTLLQQKDFLLKEVHHRVMNSLNILTSMLRLQSKHVRDQRTKDQLDRALNRVLAMASVYKYLYGNDAGSEVELAGFLRAVCSESLRAYAGAPRELITFDLEPVLVRASLANSLALVAHELITNTVKHAYSAGETGPIRIACKRVAPDELEIQYSDAGSGMPEGLDVSRPTSLGLKMISAMPKQFGGTLTIRRLNPGTEFTIRIPLESARDERPVAAS